MRMVYVRFAVVAALAAATAQARVEYSWSDPFAPTGAVISAASAGASCAVESGDQHTLYFTNGMVRAYHRVTDEWFDLQPAPFAVVGALISRRP